MPYGARPLKAGIDPMGQRCVWCMVEDSFKASPMEFLLIATGQALPKDSGVYLGTIIEGSFVWHVFTV